MNKQISTFSSLFVGVALFAIVIYFVGIESILKPFQEFSLFYLTLFLIMSFMLHVVNAWRWKTVAYYHGFMSKFWIFFKYRVIGYAISYITPSARIGGEPVKAYLYKRYAEIRGRDALSTVILETTLGWSMDALFMTTVLVASFLFFTVPERFGIIALLMAMLGLIGLAIFYVSLLNQIGPVSLAMRIGHSVVRFQWVAKLIEKVVMVEMPMINFVKQQKIGVLKAIAITTLTWPVTIMQYKFGLLAIGIDTGFAIIILAIIATSFSVVLPIPASLGIQEVSQASVFALIGLPNVGVALSLLLRLKDLLLTLTGFIFLSHEGLTIIDALRNKL